jgi:acetolactate synthase-1/2/3 large subunit
LEEYSAGRQVVDALEAEGVRTVFGLPGGHVLSIYDAIHASTRVEHVLVRHEHSAACMAAAYAQLTGEPGVCLVTAGPGATNLLTGIAEAFIGCLPIVVLAGRGATANALRGAAQEIATERVFAPVTKSAVRVDRPDLVADAVAHAFRVARNGRPGPVLLDLPRDVLDAVAPARPYVRSGPLPRPAGSTAAVAAAAEALAGAERPLLIAGGGAIAADAAGPIRELAEGLAMPVVTSLAGRGIVPDDHPLSVGGLGAHRNRLSKRLFAEADVVVGFGTRFEEMETNWQPGFVPAEGATYVQVDIDPGELGRGIPTQIGIVGDVGAVAGQLLGLLDRRSALLEPGEFSDHERTLAAAAEMAELREEVAAIAAEPRSPMHPLSAIRAVRRALPREGIVAVDVGVLAQHMAGANPYFEVFEPRTTIVPSSFYGMGFTAAGLPAAKLVHPDRPAVGFVGDGSFQMAWNVLPAAVERRLGVTWCILNDGALGSIWDIQRYRFGNRILGTEFEHQPDFAAVAEGCGCHGERVEDQADAEAAVRRALAANEAGVPAVIDFAVSRERLLGTVEHYAFYPEELVAELRRPFAPA